ncbi:MAG: DUF4252 domain-containing protein [Bacteroidales bacterium]|nr:DUF4252 domain-containing protein [Bacteroidales bacterium]
MKRMVVFIALLALASLIYGQKSIDDLFDKYSGKVGYVTLTFKGDMLKLLNLDEKCRNRDNKPINITEIRILAPDNETVQTDNFCDLIIKKLKLNDYEEFISVNKSDQGMKVLIRADGNSIREFLLVSGGDDNVLIQVKGKMTFDQAERLSSEVSGDYATDMLPNQ